MTLLFRQALPYENVADLDEGFLLNKIRCFVLMARR
jgi:hypothetical protein